MIIAIILVGLPYDILTRCTFSSLHAQAQSLLSSLMLQSNLFNTALVTPYD